ncbi:hypothetical protein PCK1_002947 [Pneumocystis canis]|nr:hypothetical protein PCK1_002947 [Pneumocystis canis]
MLRRLLIHKNECFRMCTMIISKKSGFKRSFWSQIRLKREELKPETQSTQEPSPITQESSTCSFVNPDTLNPSKQAVSAIDIEKEIAELKDRYLRSVADFRNLQLRTQREVSDAKLFAIQQFAKDLINSVDNLERALATVPEDSLKNVEKNKELVDLYTGLKMTETILNKTLEKHGLIKYDGVGEKFDPNLHEAVYQVSVPGKEAGTIFHNEQTGFILNGRVIRPAKVGVVKESVILDLIKIYKNEWKADSNDIMCLAMSVIRSIRFFDKCEPSLINKINDTIQFFMKTNHSKIWESVSSDIQNMDFLLYVLKEILYGYLCMECFISISSNDIFNDKKYPCKNCTLIPSDLQLGFLLLAKLCISENAPWIVEIKAHLVTSYLQKIYDIVFESKVKGYEILYQVLIKIIPTLDRKKPFYLCEYDNYDFQNETVSTELFKLLELDDTEQILAVIVL